MRKLGILFLLGGIVAIGVVFVGRTIFGATSYQECMVREMRGLPQIMYGNVDKLCSQRFEKEIEIFQRDQTEWSYNFFVVSIKPSATSEYIMTRGTFRFSSKSCKDSAPGDFAVERTVAADADGIFSLPLVPTQQEYEKFSTPACMQTVKLWGKYK
jgi:hypothetical protein